jgi:hypothetical protein
MSLQILKPRDFYLELTNSVKRNKFNFLEQGRWLMFLRKNSVYREALGDGGADSWHEFLSQPEIGMSPTQANKLLNIYELFIIKLKYSEDEIIKISVKTLNYLVKRKDEFEKLSKELQDEIISQAQVLSHKDFKEAYFDSKSEASQELGQDKSERTYEYILMQKCHQTGNMTKVHDYDSSAIETMIMRYEDD